MLLALALALALVGASPAAAMTAEQWKGKTIYQ
jgi:hypothetical protein